MLETLLQKMTNVRNGSGVMLLKKMTNVRNGFGVMLLPHKIITRNQNVQIYVTPKSFDNRVSHSFNPMKMAHFGVT